MANPQVENGHIEIATELWEALTRIRIPGEQMQVLMVIIRKTYGWKKKIDGIPLSQFTDATGIMKPHVIRAIKGLEKKHIVTVTKKGNKYWNVYGFIKDYTKWQPLPKKATLPKKVIAVAKKGNLPLPKKVPSIDTNSKETNSKETIYIVVIGYLNKKTSKKFSHKTVSTRKHINARIAEKRTIEDFKYVIDVKAAEWIGGENEKYLCPDTLFGTKFEKYLNQPLSCDRARVADMKF